MSLYGMDISKWQTSNVITNDKDFVIIKATEGINYQDPKFQEHTQRAEEFNKLKGFYHYARPETPNTPEEEVDCFLQAVSNFVGSSIFALDWEGESENIDVSWALEFLTIFYNKTGVRPLIYLNQSNACNPKYQDIANANFGLWLADYEGDINLETCWDVIAIRQYSSNPIDLDEFFGERDSWLKYCEIENATETIEPEPQETERQPTSEFDEIIQGITAQPIADQPVDVMECNAQNINDGDFVTVNSAVDYNGCKNDDWVLDATFRVFEHSGDRYVIGTVDGITGAWNQVDLQLV